MSARKWQRWCLDECAKAGVRDVSIQPGAKHPRIVGTWNGKPFRLVVMHNDGGSWRVFANTRRSIRQAIQECQR